MEEEQFINDVIILLDKFNVEFAGITGWTFMDNKAKKVWVKDFVNKYSHYVHVGEIMYG